MAKTTRTEQRSADLSTEFGLDLARRWFGDEAIASLPTRTAGKNKGAPKGFLCWKRTTEAGWTFEAGAVAAGTAIRAWIGTGPMSGEDGALSGLWMGRMQTLCGSRDVLTQAYRDQTIAERERDRAEMEAALQAREAARRG